MIFGEFTTKTGLIRVEIIDGDADEQVEISDIGTLKYEFDLVPDSPEVTAVQALYEKIEIEIFQHGYSRTDLYDRLIANVKSNDGVRVNLYLDGDQFPFFIQVNDIKLSEVDRLITLSCRVLFDDTTTVIDVFNEIPASLFETFLPDADHPTETLDATGVADWISEAMRQVFLNDFESVVSSARTGLNQNYNQRNYTSFADGIPDKVGFLMAKIEGSDFETYANSSRQDFKIIYKGDKTFSGTGFNDSIKSGDRVGVFLSAGEGAVYVVDEVLSDNEFTIVDWGEGDEINEGGYFWDIRELIYFDSYNAIESLQELAAIEGAIYGTGFGKNFFVNRILDDMIVDIPWDEITDMNPEPYWNPFSGGSVTQIARTFTNAENQTLNEGIENFGIIPVSGGNWQIPLITDAKSSLPNTEASEYKISLSLPPGYPFLNKAKGQSGLDRFLGKYGGITLEWSFDYEPSVALCSSGLKSLRKALSSDGDSLFVEFTAFDAKRVKPWNLIQIVDGVNVDAPEKYKNKTFRSTSIEYDFVKDVASFQAYEILESDIPNPNFRIEVAGSSSSSGQVITNKTFVIDVSGESESGGEVAFGETIDAVGESLSSGQVSYAVRAQVLTTPGGVDLTTPEGVLLTAVLSSGINVSGESSSAGSVVIQTASTFQLEVSGNSTSSGQVTEESFAGQPLTTPAGTILTDSLGNVLVTPILEYIDVSGDSSSAGEVTTNVVFTTEINVTGDASSAGVIDSIITRTINVSGDSSSSGSVSTIKGATKSINVSGGASSDGSVSTSVEPGGDPEPTGVSLILSGSFSLLSWQQPGYGEPNKYEIQYRINGGFWNVLDTNVSGSATNYNFDSCLIGSNTDTLRLRIRAVFTDVTSTYVESTEETITQCSGGGGGF